MPKGSPYSDWPLSLYRYLVHSYFTFLTSGRCLSYPLVVHIQTQSLCNGRCSICPYPIVSKVLENGSMDLDLFKKLSSELAIMMQVSTVVFSLQNEPLLDKRLFSWIERVKSMNPEKYCIVTTNAVLLDTFSLSEIMQSGLDRLTLSLNAYSKETYERIS